MTRFVLGALLALPAFGAEASLDRLLDTVEHRYNSINTLQVSFQETFSAGGRGRRVEAGQLFLRKPGRMRWVYTEPSGKLFVSDGKDLYYYNPTTRQAEKLKMKESEDLRAPLAFLLGKLDFQKDFQSFQSKTGPAGTVITAAPKSDKLPYREVEFTIGAQNEIRRLQVTGQDNSLLSFSFENERLNPQLEPNVFKFDLPAGGSWVAGSGAENR